jgi:hypothetical protein
MRMKCLATGLSTSVIMNSFDAHTSQLLVSTMHTFTSTIHSNLHFHQSPSPETNSACSMNRGETINPTALDVINTCRGPNRGTCIMQIEHLIGRTSNIFIFTLFIKKISVSQC